MRQSTAKATVTLIQITFKRPLQPVEVHLVALSSISMVMLLHYKLEEEQMALLLTTSYH